MSTYAGICGEAGDRDGDAEDAMFSGILDIQCLANCSVLVTEPGSGRIRLILDSSADCPTRPTPGMLQSLAKFAFQLDHVLVCGLVNSPMTCYCRPQSKLAPFQRALQLGTPHQYMLDCTRTAQPSSVSLQIGMLRLGTHLLCLYTCMACCLSFAGSTSLPKPTSQLLMQKFI